MAFQFQQSFEGGTNGSAITTGNSGSAGDTAFSSIVGAATYDTTHVAHGSLAGKIALDGTINRSQLVWNVAETTWYGRAYVYLTANPPSNMQLIRWATSTNSVLGMIRVLSTGLVQIFDNANGVAKGASTAAIALNQWVRVEYKMIPGATTGQVEVKVFNSAESTVPDFTVTSPATMNNSGVANVQMGAAFGANSTYTLWLDELVNDPAGYPGPYVAAANNLTTMKRWTGSAWTDLTIAKRWDGTQWVDLTTKKIWNGSAWGSDGGNPPSNTLTYNGVTVWGLNEGSSDPSAVAWTTYVNDLAAAGAKLNAYRSYHKMSNGTTAASQVGNTDTTRHNAGAMLVHSLRCDVGGTTVWADMAAGAYDAYLDAVFNGLLGLNYADDGSAPPNAIFMLDPEMDRFQTGGSTVHGSAADFVAAHRYAYNRLRAMSHPNVSRILFGWCFAGFGLWHVANPWNNTCAISSASCRITGCWPGDDYVDIICPDEYNKYGSWGSGYSPLPQTPEWHAPSTLFQNFFNWCTNSGNGIGKQIMVVEGDCQEYGSLTASWDVVSGGGKGPFPSGATQDDGTLKAQWFQNLGQYLHDTPLAVGWVYWQQDYPPTTTTLSYNGWKTGAVTAQS